MLCDTCKALVWRRSRPHRLCIFVSYQSQIELNAQQRRKENISLSFNLNGRGILCHPVKGWFRGPFLPVLNFNLLKAIQDPLYFVPNILIGQNVKKVKEVFPVCSASVRRTPFKGILSRIKAPEILEVLQLFKFCFFHNAKFLERSTANTETPVAELMWLQYVQVGVLDFNMLTCRIQRSETPPLMLRSVLVDPSL